MAEIKLDGACVFWGCDDKATYRHRFCDAHFREMEPDLSMEGCIICGGRLRKANRSMICTSNKRCVKAGMCDRQMHRSSQRERRHKSSLLPTVYDLDDGSEIVDLLAVDMAAEGMSKVRLTGHERRLVMRFMLAIGTGPHQMAYRLGTSRQAVNDILTEFGLADEYGL